VTAYALITKEDFTIKWGLIVVVAFSMLLLAIFGLFWPTSSFLYTFYCWLGVVLFGIYLIIDTQMILGGKRIQLTVDEYVAAAMLLYIDIIQIFLYILSMLSKK
jgi:FtsH-binding integral membrane protein